jgi:hypothetical protein
VPIAIIGLTVIRGLAGFISQYGLTWAASRATQAMRRAMFQRVLDAEPLLFTRNTASNLVNTLTFEVQAGATQLVYSVQSLVGDSLRFVALLGYLVWLNWQLTVFVAIVLPVVAYVTRKFSRRMHRLTVEGQHSVDALPTSSRRTSSPGAASACMPPRPRNDALRERQRQAAPAVDEVGGRRDPDADHAGARLCALAVIAAAPWQSARGDNGGRLRRLHRHAAADPADEAPLRARRADHARAGRGRQGRRPDRLQPARARRPRA